MRFKSELLRLSCKNVYLSSLTFTTSFFEGKVQQSRMETRKGFHFPSSDPESSLLGTNKGRKVSLHLIRS